MTWLMRMLYRLDETRCSIGPDPLDRLHLGWIVVRLAWTPRSWVSFLPPITEDYASDGHGHPWRRAGPSCEPATEEMRRRLDALVWSWRRAQLQALHSEADSVRRDLEALLRELPDVDAQDSPSRG